MGSSDLEQRVQRLEEKSGRDWAPYIVAVAALAAALIGAVPVIKDLLPRDPARQEVDIANVHTELGWTYGEFLKETKREESLNKAWQNWPGSDVSFEIKLIGYKKETLKATGWVVSAGAGERIRELYRADIPTTIVPSTSTYKANPSIWVAIPKKKGTYRITVGIYTEKNHRLAELDSDTITVS